MNNAGDSGSPSLKPVAGGDEAKDPSPTTLESKPQDVSSPPKNPSSPKPEPMSIEPEKPLSNEEVEDGVISDSNDKDESEAETIVLPGKGGSTSGEGREVVKREDDSDEDPAEDHEQHVEQDTQRDVEMKDVAANGEAVTQESPEKKVEEAPEPNEADKMEVTMEETSPNSHLSSVPSSPEALTRSSQQHESDSEESRSSPPRAAAERSSIGSRKRKLAGEFADEISHRPEERRQRQREKTVDRPTTNAKEQRRETRSATHGPPHRPSPERSSSPQLRTHRRARSTQSIDPSTNGQYSNIRRSQLSSTIPHDRYVSEGGLSDSSTASGQTQLRRVSQREREKEKEKEMAFVSAKAMPLPPHKKHVDGIGRTLLARAAAAADLDAVRTRFEERPDDIDIPDNAGNTPLQISALEGRTEIVEFLLNNGSDPDHKNYDGDTPLIDAIQNGHTEVVTLLLKAGANPLKGTVDGTEPLDVLEADKKQGNIEDDEYVSIKSALLSAMSKGKRKPSQDHGDSRSNSVKEGSEPTRFSGLDSPREQSPMSSIRSPPRQSSSGARRRTGRSEATRNDLLWIRPSLETLRDRAGKGDAPAVAMILNTNVHSDVESMIAAARGGHEDVMQLLFAMGNGDADPEPIRSANYKSGYNTPMLAAIGRGNEKIIELLLGNKCDPTRRDHKGQTYYEIAKERQGPNWEKEYEILKNAYDNYDGSPRKTRNGLRNSSSPEVVRRTRGSTTDNAKREGSRSVSPITSRQRKVNQSPKHTTRNSDSSKRTASPQDRRRARVNLSSVEQKPETSGQARKATRRSSSSAIDRGRSDAKPERSVSAGIKRRPSEATNTGSDGEFSKRTRRLMSAKQLRTSQEKKRRESVLSSASSLSSIQRDDPDDSDSILVTAESSRKASRKRSDANEGRSRAGTVKRERSSDSDGLGQDASINRFRSNDSKSRSRSRDQRESAPRVEERNRKRRIITSDSLDAQTDEGRGRSREGVDGDGAEACKENSQVNATQETTSADKEQEKEKSEEEKEAERMKVEEEARKLAEERKKTEEERKKEEERARELEKEKLLEAAREEEREKERLARAEMEALKRRADEAQRQIRMAQEEEDFKRRRDEDIQKRKAEQERLKREEQERRRLEHEERERQQAAERLRKQQEEDLRQRRRLPNSLCRSFGLSVEQMKTPSEVQEHWLPLYTVTTSQFDPDCPDEVKDDKWVPNFQVAPILGIKDLDLSQYTAWSKRPFTERHKTCVWRIARRMLAEDVRPVTWSNLLPSLDLKLRDEETKLKFWNLEHLFWVKLSDLLDIVPRYPHLLGLNLRTQMVNVNYHDVNQHGGVRYEFPGQSNPPKQEGDRKLTNGTSNEPDHSNIQESHPSWPPQSREKPPTVKGQPVSRLGP